jgi:hypothetical protein
MGEVQGTLFRPEFNRSIQVEARRERLSADTGALLLRELVQRLGLPVLLRKHLTDPRDPTRTIHPFMELVLTHVLMDAQGWNDQADVSRLRKDPILRLAVSGRRGDGPLRSGSKRAPDGLCSQSTLSRLLGTLGVWENRIGLEAVLLGLAERRAGLSTRHLDEIVLDLDSIPVVVHGHQPGSAYNGHFRARCYHPVVVRWDRGDYLAAELRPGNAHTADGALGFVWPIIEWALERAQRVWLRMDAGFPEPELLGTLEDAGVRYVARLRSNRVLQRLAAPYLEAPRDQELSVEAVRVHELSYQAGTWECARRVVLVMVEREDEQGELFSDHFFLLTNAPAGEVSGAALLERYRQRGTAEKDFGEWKNALDLSLSSTPRPKSHYREKIITTPYEESDSFAANEARMLLSLLAANVLTAAAELLSRHLRQACSRERFRQLVLRVAGRVLFSGRRITVVVNSAVAPLWSAVWTEMERAYPARGSPDVQVLPIPA